MGRRIYCSECDCQITGQYYFVEQTKKVGHTSGASRYGTSWGSKSNSRRNYVSYSNGRDYYSTKKVRICKDCYNEMERRRKADDSFWMTVGVILLIAAGVVLFFPEIASGIHKLIKFLRI